MSEYINKKLSIGLLGTTVAKVYRDQINACLHTWIPDTEKLGVRVKIFCGDVISDLPIINLLDTGEDVLSATNKQTLGLRYLYENVTADFYFFGGIDNYVITNRILSFLQLCDPTELLYIGGSGEFRELDNEKFYYHSGGAGFILSHALLKVLYESELLSLEANKRWDKICLKNEMKMHDAPDTMLGYFLFKYVPNTITICDDRFISCSMFCYSYNDGMPCCKVPHDWSRIFTVHYMNYPTLHEFHNYLNYQHDNKIDPRWCFVTSCLNDKHYLSEFVLKLHVNLVIFCDLHRVDYFINKRTEYGLKAHTIVIPYFIKDSPFSQYKERIYHLCVDSDNLLTCHKYALLKEAVDVFPNVTHMAWIDFNIQRIVGEHAEFQIYRLIKEYRDKCSFCLINYTSKDAVTNLAKFYGLETKDIVCDFFTGSKENILKLYTYFYSEFVRTINEKYFHDDVKIMVQLMHKIPDLLEFYYGNLNAIFANYDRIRTFCMRILNNIIANARGSSNNTLALDACEKLLVAVDKNHCVLNCLEIIRLVDEMYISAYYTGKRDKCKKALQYYDVIFEKRKLTKLDGSVETVYNYTDMKMAISCKIAHMISNSDFEWGHLQVSEYAVVTCEKLTLEEVLVHPVIEALVKMYHVIVYGDYKLTEYALCSRRLIIRPETHRLELPESKIKILMNIN